MEITQDKDGRPCNDGQELPNNPDRGRRPPQGDPPPPDNPNNPPGDDNARNINNPNNPNLPPDDPGDDDPDDHRPARNPRKIAKDESKNKSSTITLPALPPPAGFYFWRG